MYGSFQGILESSDSLTLSCQVEGQGFHISFLSGVFIFFSTSEEVIVAF